MDKPTKPTNLMPRSFGGTKNNFSTSLQSTGYEDGVPAIYGGDNLNYQLDATGKELDYCEKICDFINGIPIGKTIMTDSNNKLVYANTLDFLSRNIGEIVTSTIPLTDAGLHLLDGALISGSGSYSAFVNYIADLYADSNYSAIFETEANWQTAVTTYGVCGKFVYDSVNNTVRLPKITGFIEGTTDTTALLDLVEAGLPNITGETGGYVYTGSNGALSAVTRSDTAGRVNGGSGQWGTIVTLDASNSNSIYGNSSTVQPQAIKVLYYIVIATTTKTDIQVDIDEIATDLNGKADVDLTNVNNSGTSRGAGWAMPSNIYENLTIGSTGATYTAPANGWFCCVVNAAANTEVDLVNTSTGMQVSQVHPNTIAISLILPVLKGNVIRYYFTLSTGGLNNFYFFYAKGSESEAS